MCNVWKRSRSMYECSGCFQFSVVCFIFPSCMWQHFSRVCERTFRKCVWEITLNDIPDNPFYVSAERAVEGDLTTRAEGVIRPPDINLQVVDAYGEWTSLWKSQFTALTIPHLRSHTLVHTDPVNKVKTHTKQNLMSREGVNVHVCDFFFLQKALQEFVLKHNRSTELHSLPDRVLILDDNAFFNDTRLGRKERKRLNVSSNLKNSLSFSLPGTQLSVDFFKDQVGLSGIYDVLN